MRGFGMTYDVARGISRNWYAGEDGVMRWADDDTPVDIPRPIDPTDPTETVEVSDEEVEAIRQWANEGTPQ